jgi:hypothetical protein
MDGASFELIAAGARHVFDSFECAIQAMAPVCEHCHCRVIGHVSKSVGDSSAVPLCTLGNVGRRARSGRLAHRAEKFEVFTD